MWIDEIESLTNLPVGMEFTIIKKDHYKGRDLVVKVSENGCWEVISHKPDGNGYGQYKQKRVHVRMFEQYQRPTKKGEVVRHECDNPICCNPFHLIIGTQKENCHDTLIRNGNPQFLPYETAKKIAECHDTIKNIMDEYNVSYDVVFKIKNNITWKNEFNITPLVECGRKLNKYDVINIYTSELSGIEIAKLYGISPNTVYDIRKKRIWRKITDEISQGEV